MRCGIGRFSVLIGLVPAAALPPDLGAKVFNVNIKTDAVDVDPGNGRCRTAANKCSLRAAVMEANALPGADEIVLQDKAYILTIIGPPEDAGISGDLDILEDLAITGAGRKKTFVDGGRIDRVFHIYPGVSQAAFNGLTIQNGITSSLGAGIYNEGARLLVTACNVAGNMVRNDILPAVGGGIANIGAGTVILRNSSVVGNLVASGDGGRGGGIFSDSGLLKIIHSKISGNLVSGLNSAYGGGIFNWLSDLKVLQKSKITHNTVVGDSGTMGFGGGISTEQASLVIKNSAVAYNLAHGEGSSYGGGIESINGQNRVIGSKVRENRAAASNSAFGGGMYTVGGELVVRKSNFSGNTADSAGGSSFGGGIFSEGLTISIKGSTLSRNLSKSVNSSFGGALHSGGTAAIDSCRIKDNRALARASSYGGGIFNSSVKDMDIIASTIAGNSAVGTVEARGGGILTASSSFLDVRQGSSVTGNLAAENGGGIFVESSATLEVSPDSAVKRNIPNNFN